jgi:D-gamma-glutamyl-meso-diaminopimelic acid endopeptidase CwlS
LDIILDTGRSFYVVEGGDTLSEIAVRFGTTLDEVLKANPQIEDASLIFPGERIVIPNRSGS